MTPVHQTLIIRFRRAALAVAMSYMAIGAIATCAAPAEVRLERIDGTTLDGVWIGSSDGNVIEIRSPQGTLTLPLSGLSTITFGKPGPGRTRPAIERPQTDRHSDQNEVPNEKKALFHLADGGWLHGHLLNTPHKSDCVFSRSALGDAVALPFDRLAGIRIADPDENPRADATFRETLQQRLPGHDVLVTRDEEGVKKLRGRLVQLGTAEGSFEYGGQTRTFKAHRIFGVVLAGGPPDSQARPYPVTVHLRDGSILSGHLERADAGSLQLETSLRYTAHLPVTAIDSLRITSDRVVMLTDLEPTEQRVDGLIHRPWPVRKDRNTAGGPIVMGGRTFERGLGVHSRTELTYDIEGKYETFVATIGLDDSVRPRGNVLFRLLDGDKKLWDSGPVTGQDDPRDIIVAVTAVDTLTLVVDYGDALDIADHANWGGARLLKPASDSTLKQQ